MCSLMTQEIRQRIDNSWNKKPYPSQARHDTEGKGHEYSEKTEKSESSLHKRRGLRNCEKGMEFLTCDGCEDDYNK